MKLSYKSENYAIFDDFLNEEEFEYIYTFMQDEEYSYFQAEKWKKINRITDGNHLEGKGYLSINGPTFKNMTTYPTGTAMDLFNEIVESRLNHLEEYIGKKGKDWEFYSLKPFLYPKDTGVSWHDDYTKSSGTFTFYCHPYWNIQWGGELLIALTSERNSPPQFRKKYNFDTPQPIDSAIDNEKRNRVVMDPGYGHYILPKPNRLVVMSSGTSHMVKKVENSAGDKVRLSIQGFFHSPNKPEGRY